MIWLCVAWFWVFLCRLRLRTSEDGDDGIVAPPGAASPSHTALAPHAGAGLGAGGALVVRPRTTSDETASDLDDDDDAASPALPLAVRHVDIVCSDDGTAKAVASWLRYHHDTFKPSVARRKFKRGLPSPVPMRSIGLEFRSASGVSGVSGVSGAGSTPGANDAASDSGMSASSLPAMSGVALLGAGLGFLASRRR